MNSSSENPNSTEHSWEKEGSIRELRLRMGWSRADIARRLGCSSEDVKMFEQGERTPESHMKSELEFLLRQADACSDEVRLTPSAENKCAQNALQQVDFSRIKAEIE